jgi:hypothetical protein
MIARSELPSLGGVPHWGGVVETFNQSLRPPLWRKLSLWLRAWANLARVTTSTYTIASA